MRTSYKSQNEKKITNPFGLPFGYSKLSSDVMIL